MVSKFFQRTVLSHIAFVGIGYLVLHGICLCLFLRYGDSAKGYAPPPAPLVFVLTLFAALFYGYRLRKYRPVPHNPIQQFQINLIVALYAIVIALSVVIPLCAGLQYEGDVGIWPLLAALYVFFAWRHVYGVDIPIVRDVHGRPMSDWDYVIFDTKKSGARFRRSNIQWR